AIGNASRHGTLIKGGAYLEQAASLRVIALDKTGTLTEGRPEVTDVCTLHGYEPEELIALAAVVEERSEHPLAAAVLRRRQHELEQASCPAHGDHPADHVHLFPHDESEAHLAPEVVSDFEAITGRGSRVSLDGKVHFVGSPRLFAELGIDLTELQSVIREWQAGGKSVLLVGGETEVYGALAIADRERAEAGEVVRELRRTGIRRVVMLTGDNRGTAEAVAQRIGVDEYRAELLPEDKVEAVHELIDRHGRVAMVGDGVNDAPALAVATVSVAMGAAGSDTALETADIVLMGDDLSRLPFVLQLSRRALRTIKLNVVFALGVKAAVITLTFFGITHLWLAILADTGASLLVIANGMRLLGVSSPLTQPPAEPPPHSATT
ncbi:MAG: heavy metal translocating P-type ATPase, partial [Chloroflexota bacterium]|nr:heavy metal translocating P-type ATPase [Chloroflexota bacterium]